MARLSPIVLVVVFLLAVALSFLAPPRRTGDAHQYLAMSRQLAQLRLPSLTLEQERSYQAWLASHPPESGFPDSAPAVRQPALIRDGRQEFSHFWFFPLLAAPATALTGVLGAHPLAAFTLTNATLLAVALWSVARAFGSIAALLAIASPLIWFIGRAQVEIFTVSLLFLVMAAAMRGHWSLAALGLALASTQNAPIAAAIPLVWAAGITVWIISRKMEGRSVAPNPRQIRRALLLGFATLMIALVHPTYYFIQLGVLTPQQLNGGIAGAVPSTGQFLAPLLDTDIGFIPWMPALAALTMVGIGCIANSCRRGTTGSIHLAVCALLAAGLGTWFLFVFAQTTNVNSGGTVHVSRYALWLIPLTLPVILAASQFLDARAPGLLLAASVLLSAAYLSYFRPDQPERYVEHSPQATWLMTNAPAAYRPIPEIFVERTRHIDGGPRQSAAIPSCGIILIVASHPEQPCALSSSEDHGIAARFAAGDAAVWLRRDAQGGSALTPAIAAP